LLQVFDDATIEPSRLRVDAQVWVTLIITTLHEMAHACGCNDDEADAKAKDVFTTMAQKYDIECPAIPDMSWLGTNLDIFFSSIENSKITSEVLQREMMAEGVVYKFESGRRYSMLREWVRAYNQDRAQESAWDLAVHPLVQKQPLPVAPAVELGQMTGSILDVPDMSVPDTAGNLPFDLGLEGVFNSEFSADDDVDVVAPDFGGFDLPGAATTTAPTQLKRWEQPSKFQPKPLNLPPETVRDTVQQIFKGCMIALFVGGKWQNGAFQDAEYISRTEVGINKIPHATDIVLGMDTVVNGKKDYDIPSNGTIRGFIGARSKLPQYVLHLNNGASVERYDMVPQNPNTTSKWAEAARGGEMIMWVIKGGKYLYRFTCPGPSIGMNNITGEKLV
jgi:hypothetical protein